MTISKDTLSKMIFCKMTRSIMTLRITTPSIAALNKQDSE